MRKGLLLALWLFVSITALAVPAKRVWRTIQQSDGSEMQLMLVGDEHLHYYVTTDYVPVVEINGSYVYATASENGVIASDILAHDVTVRSAKEVSALKKLGDQNEGLQKAYSRAVVENHPRSRVTPMGIGTPNPNLNGERKGLVILISFADNDFTLTNPKQEFEEMCNVKGYSKNGAVGSVHDYFYDCSNGKLSLTFDVVGPFKASKNMAYYGDNNDANVHELIKEAVKAADNSGVDFTIYDWDDDGFVDQIYVVYAGYGQASGAPSYTIWPHESSLGYRNEFGMIYDQTIKVDGKRVNTYACGCELQGTSGATLDGLGTLCHEFSHCLGLPDFYDTSGNSGNKNTNYGMYIWDIMDQGPYNGNGFVPPAYTGYERNFCGWIDYRVLDPEKPCKVTGLKSVAAGGEVYQIKNPDNPNECFLIENRYAGIKWDRGLANYLGSSYGGGLLVTHLYFVKSRWTSNTVNTGKGIQCFTPVIADNDPNNRYTHNNGHTYLNPSGVAGDLFGVGRNTEFTTTTTPELKFHTQPQNMFTGGLTRMKKRGGVCDFVWMKGTKAWEDVTDGIADVNTEADQTTDNRVYNINGQYVGTSLDGLQKGVYIQNGKKVIVK